jgi:hypothetical protein
MAPHPRKLFFPFLKSFFFSLGLGMANNFTVLLHKPNQFYQNSLPNLSRKSTGHTKNLDVLYLKQLSYGEVAARSKT